MEGKSNRLYAEMPPVRLFFHAAIPGVISMCAMSIYSIIEGIFVGQFVGGDAFAAMNLAMSPWVSLHLRCFARPRSSWHQSYKNLRLCRRSSFCIESGKGRTFTGRQSRFLLPEPEFLRKFCFQC